MSESPEPTKKGHRKPKNDKALLTEAQKAVIKILKEYFKFKVAILELNVDSLRKGNLTMFQNNMTYAKMEVEQ